LLRNKFCKLVFINPQFTDKHKDNTINLIYKILMQDKFLTLRSSAQKRS